MHCTSYPIDAQHGEPCARQRWCLERGSAIDRFHVLDIEIQQFDLRAAQIAAVVEPPTADLGLFLADVLADVPDRRAVVAVQLNGGRKPKRPLRQIVHDVSAALKPRYALIFAPWTARLAAIGGNDRAAINDAQRGVKEAVEVNRAILMQLRHKDILQPVPPDLIVQPLVKLARDRRHVMAIDAPPIKRQRHKIAEVVAQRQIADLRPRPTLRPQL